MQVKTSGKRSNQKLGDYSDSPSMDQIIVVQLLTSVIFGDPLHVVRQPLDLEVVAVVGLALLVSEVYSFYMIHICMCVYKHALNVINNFQT